MKLHLIFSTSLLLLVQTLFAQQNVGINTTSPQANLHVNGSFKLQNGVPVNAISADTMLLPGSDSILPTQKAVRQYLKGATWAPPSGESDSILALINQIQGEGKIIAVHIEDTLAFVTSLGTLNYLSIYNVSDPMRMELLSKTSLYMNAPHRVDVENGYAYVTNYANSNALSVFDVSNPDTIVPVTQLSTWNSDLKSAVDVDVAGTYAYVLQENPDQLRIYNISNLPVITEVSNTGEVFAGPRDVKVVNNIAYVVSTESDQLTLFDVSNPSSMIQMANLTDSIYFPTSVDIEGNLAYVGSHTGLTIFDISNPSNPFVVHHIPSSIAGIALCVDVQGPIAYVADFNHKSIRAIDVSDPAHPELMSEVKQFGDGVTFPMTQIDVQDDVIFGGSHSYAQLGAVKWVKAPEGRTLTMSQEGDMAFTPDAWQKDSLSNLFTQGVHNVGIGTYSPKAALHLAGNMKIDYGNTIEFGASVPGKHVDAGKIGYQTFSGSALDIVGAGPPGNKRVYIYADGGTSIDGSANVNGNLTVHNGWVGINTFPTTQLHLAGSMKINGANTIEFGAGVEGKNADAGKIGYQTFSNGLDIVGAGTSHTNRKISLYAEGGTTIVGDVNMTHTLSIHQNAFVDGFIGIGTSEPQYPLDVSGRIRLRHLNQNAGMYLNRSNNEEAAFMGMKADSLIGFYANAANGWGMLMNTNTGMIGIGDINPKASLHINGPTKMEGGSTLEFGAGIPGKHIDAGKIGYQAYSANALDIVGAGAYGSRKIKFHAEGGTQALGKFTTDSLAVLGRSKFSKTNFQDSVTISAPTKINSNLLVNNGWVGIGNSAPTVPLHLSGLMKIDGTNFIEFGAGIPGKHPDAGKMGYNLFSNSLDIVGAGSPNNRSIKLWAEGGVHVEGNLYTTNYLQTVFANVTDKLGVRISNPQYPLDVNGRIRIRNYNGETAGIFFNRTNDMVEGFVGMHSDYMIGFYGNAQAKWGLVVNTLTGQVGIGTTNPTAMLHLVGNQKMENTSVTEYGAGVANKHPDAGKIGYQTFTPTALDIVGAGNSEGLRTVKIWDLLSVPQIATEQWAYTSAMMQNGWADYGSGYELGSFMKDPMGFVHLRGTLYGGSTAPGTVLFTLPADYSPYGILIFAVPNSTTFARIEVHPDGKVKFFGSTNASVTLDPIIFKVD